MTAVAVGIRATTFRYEHFVQTSAQTVTHSASCGGGGVSCRSGQGGRGRGGRLSCGCSGGCSGGCRSGDRSGGWTGLTGGNIHLPSTPGQRLVKLEWRHAGHHPAPALPALAELSMTVVLLEVPVLLTDIVPLAGVPLGGGGGGGGLHSALRHLPRLGALLVLLAPDPWIPAVSVETEAKEALAPFMTTSITGAACSHKMKTIQQSHSEFTRHVCRQKRTVSILGAVSLIAAFLRVLTIHTHIL